MMERKAQELYSAGQVRELERRVIEAGTPGYELMCRAAAAAVVALKQRWPAAARYVVVCGGGNNGGDGYEIARALRRAGAAVEVWQVGASASTGDAVTAHAGWLADGGEIRDWQPGAALAASGDVVIDALFGIGLSRDLGDPYRAAVEAINAAHAAGAGVLAVDIPSGLHADTGTVLGDAVVADLTVTFIAAKAGLYVGGAADHVGTLVLDDLGIEAAPSGDSVRLLDRSDLRTFYPRRRRSAHKGDNGHVLLIGGDHGMAGAILIAARAALRAGAGLVSVATRATHAALLTAAQPEVMFHGVETDAELRALMTRADVVAVGPGLGQGPWGWIGTGLAWSSPKPVVADADALNLLVKKPERRDNWVLTPHPGEAARLLGTDTEAVQTNRIAAALALHARYGGVAVLKGPGTIISGSRLQVCPYGNPGMGVGGMGDALTGIIAAGIAQGLSPEDAAIAGVLVHALAGDAAAADGERGLLPSDLIAAIREVVNP